MSEYGTWCPTCGEGSGLNTLARECRRIADEHGFKDASIPEDVALMHSELSELLEDFRAGKLAHEMEYAVSLKYTNTENTSTVEGISAGALEQMRRDGQMGLGPQVASAKPCGIPSEVADVIIRALHFSAKHGIDVQKAVAEKMNYNASRPFMHGGKKI